MNGPAGSRITRRQFISGTTACAALTLVGVDPTTGTARAAFRHGGPTPDRWAMSVCPYCGVGCGLDVGVADNKVVAVRGMKDHPVNRGEFCILARKLAGMLHTEDRLLHPMRRTGRGFDRIGWPEATKTVADRIRSIIDKHGPDAFAMYVSASEHIEEYYVYNKLVKGCLGTNNLESSARLCWASGVVGIAKAFGADSPPCAYDDLEVADLFFVAGYNPSSAKPVFFKRMMMAKMKNEATMIVVDPRVTDTARFATLHLRIKPGTDVVLHNAIAHALIAEKLIDEDEARSLTANYDELKEHVRTFTPAVAADVTGIPAAQIVKAAKMIGRAKAALFMWGQGLNQSRIGTRKVTTLLNLAFITGNVGKPGAGPMAVTGQTSAMGLREVGALPHLLPGFRSVTDERARRDVAAIWGVDPKKMSPKKGKPIGKILEAIDAGEIKALWIIHSNPAATFPDTNWARSVLAKTDFLVVQDCYHPTETTHYADVLLPAAQWSEKAGTMTNSERGLNLVEAAATPPGEAKPDLDIVVDVAKALGFAEQFAFGGPEDVFEEYKKCTAGRPCDIRGVSYARLRKDKGIQWPVPTAEHPGTKRRFMDRAFPKGKLALNLHVHDEPAERTDAAHPLLLMTGLVSMQYHSRTRTGKIEAFRRAAPEPFVEIHPLDAAASGVEDGEMAKVASPRGAVEARVRVTGSVPPGAVFVPYHFGYLAGEKRAVNALTNRSFDEFAGQPEFKACAVRVEKLA